MKRFDQIVGQTRGIDILRRDVREQKVKHAYLFSGPRGVGKRTTAEAFARLLFCQEPQGGPDSCGMCRSCRRMEHGQYPDFHRVVAEKKVIRIDQVREIQKQLGLKNVEGKWRIILIDKMETMTQDAANCLLKSLEEPPQGTVFLLTTDNLSQLLETVISRCQLVRFQLLEPDSVRDILEGYPEMDDRTAKLLSTLSAGSVGDVIAKRQSLLEAGEWMDLGSLLRKNRKRTQWFARVDEMDKLDCLEELLDCWMIDFREALLAGIFFDDGVEKQVNPLCEYSETFLTSGIALIQDMKKKMRSHVNNRLALDILFQRMFDALEESRGGKNGRI